MWISSLFHVQVHVVVVDDLFGKLGQHLLFAPANDDPLEALMELVQVAVAENSALLVAAQHEVFGGKFPERGKERRIEELHDGIDVLEPVFQGGAGEDHGMFPGNGFDRFGGLGGKILDALCLIQDHQVRFEPGKERYIP